MLLGQVLGLEFILANTDFGSENSKLGGKLSDRNFLGIAPIPTLAAITEFLKNYGGNIQSHLQKQVRKHLEGNNQQQDKEDSIFMTPFKHINRFKEGIRGFFKGWLKPKGPIAEEIRKNDGTLKEERNHYNMLVDKHLQEGETVMSPS